ncbi:class I SAM-dependent methyltransferase [Bisbaumannia pacifica]|uniref:class I SAM-dependent methyltransferase n=1 Tax=Bisbaumannia pacifica TaxID=77098 RepID=UPI00307A5AC2
MMKCRHCASPLEHVFLDLGFAPPSNAYLFSDDLSLPEISYPLKLYVCENCWLVQTQDFIPAEGLFDKDYSYFSSVSSSWLRHARDFCESMKSRLFLDNESFVVEIASNDGYLLKNFVDMGVPCLGVEPTEKTAEMAEKQGVATIRRFFDHDFSEELVKEKGQADLVVANNVYAHVPDINDFTLGLAAILKPKGTLVLEFPHLMRMIEGDQFDTVYHEHFSYFSLFTVNRIFRECGLKLVDVDELPTHGGSLRVYGAHEADTRAISDSVAAILEREKSCGLQQLSTYLGFNKRAERIKVAFLDYLIDRYKAGRVVVGYGAAAKGNTLLNYSGVKKDLLPFIVDAAPSKQGKFLPGSHIPVLNPDALWVENIDEVIIFPWNISDEIKEQLSGLSEKGVAVFTLFEVIEI